MLWSDPATWGQITPLEGDDVYIAPGMQVIFDQDSSQAFDTVTVEGSLIFLPDPVDSDHVRSFSANQIFVNGGYVQMGTESEPYTSKLVITLKSNDSFEDIPMFGRNVIGVLNGLVEAHGVAREMPWLELKYTAPSGADSIILMHDATATSSTASALDWLAGEQIVVASSDFDGRHAEVRTIVSVSNSAKDPILVLDKPLSYTHEATISEIDEFFELETRSAVAVLSRNIKIQGDQTKSEQNQ